MAKLLCAVLVGTIVSGTPAPAHAPAASHIIPGVARMLSAGDMDTQWHVARQICAENGLADASGPFAICATDYWTHSLRALRARFKALTDAVARQHRLCLDRHRSGMVPCADI